MNKKRLCYVNIAFMITFICFLAYLSFFYNDTDLYYLVANGQYMLKNGIITVNPFSYNPTQVTIQNWLWCVIVGFFYENFNDYGLMILQFLCLLLMFTLMNIFLKDKNIYERYIMITLLLLCFTYINLRPEMITFIFIMVQILCMEKGIKEGRYEYLAVIPLLTFLEANIHSSYLFTHILVALPYIASDILRTIMRKRNVSFKDKLSFVDMKATILLLVSLFISFITSCFNPYGKDSVLYIKDAILSDTMWIIAEHEKMSFFRIEFLPIIISMILFFTETRNGIRYIYGRKRNPISVCSFETVFMYIGFFILICRMIKWLPFFTIGFLYILRDFDLSKTVKNILKRYDIRKDDRKICTVSYLMVLLIMLCCMNFQKGWIDKTSFYEGGGLYNDMYPLLSAVDSDMSITGENEKRTALRKDVNIYSLFSDSNYLEFMGYKIYCDARPELYPDMEEDSLMISYGKDLNRKCVSFKEYEDTIEKIDASYYMVDKKKEMLLYIYLSEREKLLDENDHYAVFKKI